MSRAQWVAFGPLALAGCNAHVLETKDADAMVFDAGVSRTTTVDANTFDDQASIDASGADATVDDAADEVQRMASSCPPVSNCPVDGTAPAPFPSSCCNNSGFCCNPRTEYYEVTASSAGGSVCFGGMRCVSFDHLYGVSFDNDAGASANPDASCAAAHTCACLNNVGTCYASTTNYCECSEDDAGRVLAFYQPCYGAPPARLRGSAGLCQYADRPAQSARARRHLRMHRRNLRPLVAIADHGRRPPRGR